jgi:hypothetical protein
MVFGRKNHLFKAVMLKPSSLSIHQASSGLGQWTEFKEGTVRYSRCPNRTAIQTNGNGLKIFSTFVLVFI